eukprot:CAMPEP_0115883496 /NCGR_PEP_ID=MMETSP0287-20121206/29596_1 /TAXON_ID=412157 /ORGANISM="Chrysochromulina rotalis, Strain UIO044" /LENGTH=52 /DNA_ID=CAMNT_0003339699 /DNA_START=1165 /DNA_END=1319 /DNA_ORIENTATION=-
MAIRYHLVPLQELLTHATLDANAVAKCHGREYGACLEAILWNNGGRHAELPG